MPKYYNYNNWANRSIKITPSQWYRRLPILKQILPYHVGDKVEFKLCLSEPISTPNPNYLNLNPHNPALDKYLVKRPYSVFEKIGNADKTMTTFIDESQNEVKVKVIGQIIPVEDSIVYSIEQKHSSKSQDAAIIFTTTVQSWDTVIKNISMILVSVILGGIISLAIGLLLGFIRINPAWIATW